MGLPSSMPRPAASRSSTSISSSTCLLSSEWDVLVVCCCELWVELRVDAVATTVLGEHALGSRLAKQPDERRRLPKVRLRSLLHHPKLGQRLDDVCLDVLRLEVEDVLEVVDPQGRMDSPEVCPVHVQPDPRPRSVLVRVAHVGA